LTSFTGEFAFSDVALTLNPTMRIVAGDEAGHIHLLEFRLR
jgi:hypothetical protein